MAAAAAATVLAAGVGLYATRGSAGLEPGGSSSGPEVRGEFAARSDAPHGKDDRGEQVPWPFEKKGDRLALVLAPPAKTLLVQPFSQEVPDGSLYAMPYQYATRVFERVTNDPRPLGIVRRGTPLRAAERVYGPGCKGGWYELTTGGYACTSDGFHVTDEPRGISIRQLPPRLDQPLPFAYAKAAKGALRFYRIPTSREEEKIEAYANRPKDSEGVDPGWPEVVEEVLDGAYFVALDRPEGSKDGRDFYRTVRGRYVRAEDLELRELPAMHGELLQGRWKLPLGFVHGDEPVPLHRGRREVGTADKHGRFPVASFDDAAVVAHGGLRLPRERVRVARRMDVPEGVPAEAKWVHINLTEQTLVAYEGSRPVFATLVSSGLEEPEFATPEGVYQVREKHVSVTMNGPDPDAGRYEVEEVPWTQYYYDSYALHGAYWHNNFGRVRSHGCTNLAPTDARWLFHWTEPDLPPGWHARRRAEGTYVVFTRDAG